MVPVRSIFDPASPEGPTLFRSMLALAVYISSIQFYNTEFAWSTKIDELSLSNFNPVAMANTSSSAYCLLS
jgi:hypothetical protein